MRIPCEEKKGNLIIEAIHYAEKSSLILIELRGSFAFYRYDTDKQAFIDKPPVDVDLVVLENCIVDASKKWFTYRIKKTVEKLRKEGKDPYTELSNLFSINRSSIMRWESGKSTPHPVMIKSIIRRLN